MTDHNNPSIYDVKGILRCYVVGRAVHCKFGDPGLRNLTRMTETDLIVIQGIGPATIRSIRRELASRGLALKHERPE